MSTLRKSVAIHQPSFFPWLGFFDKIARADIFVILDNVQFPKTGGFWSNRVKIIVSGEPQWITMPVVRSYSGVRNINEMEINNLTSWREKLNKTFFINYKKTSYFEEIYPIVEDLVNYYTENLLEYNLNTIKKICELIGINYQKAILSSSLTTEGKATDLLISIIKQLGGNEYICGGGAQKYQENEKFEQASINLIYQNFNHPVYEQSNSKEFIKGLSIIDALFNCGPHSVSKLLPSN
jgi:hypothetical protein